MNRSAKFISTGGVNAFVIFQRTDQNQTATRDYSYNLVNLGSQAYKTRNNVRRGRKMKFRIISSERTTAFLEGEVPEYDIDIYISRRKRFNPRKAKFLGRVTITDAGEEDSVNKRVKLRIPRRTRPGVYYIVTQIDPDNLIDENDETDNVFVAKLKEEPINVLR